MILADLLARRGRGARHRKLGHREARALQLDVRDEERCAPATDGLDVLVNVAGIGSTTNAAGTPLEVWEDVFAVNARGTFLCCKHAIPGMAARGGGSTSTSPPWRRSSACATAPPTCASKGAVVA